jgi:hypothetical protein
VGVLEPEVEVVMGLMFSPEGSELSPPPEERKVPRAVAAAGSLMGSPFSQSSTEL